MFIFRNTGKTIFSWPVSNPQISLNRSHVVLTGSPPLQELIWRLVPPFASLSTLPHLFSIIAYLPVTHLIALILHAPSGLHPYFTAACQRAFPKSPDYRDTFSKQTPSPAPLHYHCWKLPGEAELCKSLLYPVFKHCLLCRGGRPAVQQLS